MVFSVYYEALKARTQHAKHLRVTHQLTGSQRIIVYHIYSEIIDSIENQRFVIPKKITAPAQVTLFTVHVSGNNVFINTHRRSGAQRIWCTKCARSKEAESMYEVIKCAVSLVELKCEPVKYGEKGYRIFYDAKGV